MKSLPQEWLWCQTWCSDREFSKAKVIDLCNNPQTKEAKLTAAQRIVPEWKDYDTEIKNLMSRVDEREHGEQIIGEDKVMPTIVDESVDDGTKSEKHVEQHSEL